MPTYRYSAIDRTGRSFTGTLDAENVDSVRNKLSELRYHIVNINEVAAGGGSSDFLKQFARVKQKELVVFSRQFATMIDAGLSVLKCLDILQRQSKDPVMRETLQIVRHDVNGGSSLTDALAKHPRVFSKLYVNMIRSAEAGGILDQVLDRLSTFLEKDMELREKVRSAMMYPIIVGVVALVVMAILMWWVLPQFKNIFRDMGIQQLPFATKMLLDVASFSSEYWYVCVAGAAGIFIAIKLYGRTQSGAMHLDRLRLAMPIFGEINLKVSVSRFARTFGTLISSGVPVLRALEITSDTTGNLVLSAVIDQARMSVREGEKISDPFHGNRYFPVMVTQMIAVGEETGRLDQMLVKVADFYDSEVDSMIKGLASLIEPIMIVGLGVMVGFIAVSVITPIYTLVGSLGG